MIKSPLLKPKAFVAAKSHPASDCAWPIEHRQLGATSPRVWQFSPECEEPRLARRRSLLRSLIQAPGWIGEHTEMRWRGGNIKRVIRLPLKEAEDIEVASTHWWKTEAPSLKGASMGDSIGHRVCLALLISDWKGCQVSSHQKSNESFVYCGQPRMVGALFRRKNIWITV